LEVHTGRAPKKYVAHHTAKSRGPCIHTFTTTVVQPKSSHVTTHVQKPTRTHLFSYSHTLWRFTPAEHQKICRTPHCQITSAMHTHMCVCMLYDSLFVIYNSVTCTTVVINVCLQGPRDLAVWCLTYFLALGRCEPRKRVSV